MKKLFSLFLLSLCATITYAQVYDLVVAQDGSGTHTSISSALSYRGSFQSIYIKNGVYQEKLKITKDNLSLIGESKEGVIIEWGDYSGDSEGNTTATSYTVQVSGDNLYAENLTIKNTAGNVGQAVALHALGQKQIFKNCAFVGFQDTYYANKGRQYNFNCEVTGATDFIFGDATSVFDESTIICVSGGSYITAPADTKLISSWSDGSFFHGLLIMDSDITAEDNVADASFYMGRPWQPNSSSVFVNCTLGNHIKPLGWSTWNDNNHLSGYYAEYKNVDKDGNLVETSNRADWSHQITDDQFANYFNLDYFLAKDGETWNPSSAVMALDAPTNLAGTIIDQKLMISWDGVNDASGYVIKVNGSVVGFSETTSFEMDVVDADNEVAVSAVASIGAQGTYSEVLSLSANVLSTDVEENLIKSLDSGILYFTRKLDVSVISISGIKIIEKKDVEFVDLASYSHIVLIVHLLENNQLKQQLKIIR